MNSQEVVDGLKQLFTALPQEGRRTDGPDEFRSDHATGLSLSDIQTCEGSSVLKNLLELGFRNSGGEMTIIITHHKVTDDRDGRYIFEFAGQAPFDTPRIGAQFTVNYDLEGHAKGMKLTPSFKMLQNPSLYEELFTSMLKRDEVVTARDAMVMITLCAKAMGIPTK